MFKEGLRLEWSQDTVPREIVDGHQESVSPSQHDVARENCRDRALADVPHPLQTPTEEIKETLIVWTFITRNSCLGHTIKEIQIDMCNLLERHREHTETDT